MLESCRHVARFVAVTTASQFAEERLFQAAIARELFILGEAAKPVPQAVKYQFPDVPWRQAAGLRDVLGHDYFGLDNDEIWFIATDDLPQLESQLIAIISVIST